MTYAADLQRCNLDNAGQARTPATTCLNALHARRENLDWNRPNLHLNKWISRSIAIRFLGFGWYLKQRNMHLSPDFNCTHWIFRGISLDLARKQAICFFPIQTQGSVHSNTLRRFSRFSRAVSSLSPSAQDMKRVLSFSLTSGSTWPKGQKRRAVRPVVILRCAKSCAAPGYWRKLKLAIAPLVIHITPRNTDKNTLPVQWLQWNQILPNSVKLLKCIMAHSCPNSLSNSWNTGHWECRKNRKCKTHNGACLPPRMHWLKSNITKALQLFSAICALALGGASSSRLKKYAVNICKCFPWFIRIRVAKRDLVTRVVDEPGQRAGTKNTNHKQTCCRHNATMN